MTWLNDKGQLWGRFNVIDVGFLTTVILAVLGIILVQSGIHETSGQTVSGETNLLLTVQIPRLKTLDQKLFVPNEKTAITIRNQPRGDVKIQSVQMRPSQITIEGANHQGTAILDKAEVNSYDFQLVLQDHAKMTEEGYVTEGVKVKVGLPIELEGFKYRVYGKIIDVQPTS